MTTFPHVERDIRAAINQLNSFLGRTPAIKAEIDSNFEKQKIQHEKDVTDATNLLAEYKQVLAALGLPETDPNPEATQTHDHENHEGHTH